MKQYPVRRGAHEFKSRATQREWDGDCPPVRAVCAGSFLSIRCGGSFWLVGAVWSNRHRYTVARFPCHTTVHAGPHTAVRWVELSIAEQLRNPERGEVDIGQGKRKTGGCGKIPRTVGALDRANGQVFLHTTS